MVNAFQLQLWPGYAFHGVTALPMMGGMYRVNRASLPKQARKAA